MTEIAIALPKSEIIKELTPEKLLRTTNKGANEIYIITHHDSPNVMHEIGRLREITFRDAGGGTGKELDIDKYDTQANCYKQLIVWNPDEQEILGGYRYMLGNEIDIDEEGDPMMATGRLFHFTETFKKDYLPYTIELGRSFVQPAYQSSKAGAKALFALDNLWDGLGALTVDHPEMKYFMGKVTMYTHFNVNARNLILYFYEKHFYDRDRIIYAKEPMVVDMDRSKMKQIFNADNYADDYKTLVSEVRLLGENIPPLVNAYMNLSPTMRTFGTILNTHFGNVEETGILLTIKDIYNAKVDRHIETYIRQKDGDDFPEVK
ncbi:MAG: GNAT family N-acetyltransferase [Mangrovibacterium sp.]